MTDPILPAVNEDRSDAPALAGPPLNALEGEPSITDIVRHRWETGAYGSAHFEMAWETAESFMRTAPRPAKPAHMQDPMADLLSIPIVADKSMPLGSWRLVDRTTGEAVHEGTAGSALNE